MQKQESWNSLSLPFKRLRDSGSYTSLVSPLMHSDFTKIAFKSIVHQSGDAKAFWYYSNLATEIQSSGIRRIDSENFCTGDLERWGLVISPYKQPISSGLYLKLELDPDKILHQRTAHIRFRLWVKKDQVFSCSVDLTMHKVFSRVQSEWGFDDFFRHDVHLTSLQSPSIIEVTVTSMSSHENSKYLTDFVGIINEGTTCYVNSLLQTLFFLTYFRKSIYHMPTLVSEGIPMALQLIFYHLQFSVTPASARQLLTSLGLSAEQFYIQHDIQEFNCVLSEKLEAKMKGTPVEGTYSKIFTGIIKNTIACLNTNYESVWFESFSEVQLNVKECQNIYESFDKYVSVEDLVGENQYDAGELGKQDARKNVIFEMLPPVLQLQLKRFEYDSSREVMNKINDRFEYFEEINLEKYVQNAGFYVYRLFSVLVHTGSTAGGHYFAYISPALDGKWFKFDDDTVDRADSSQALEANFGGSVENLEISNLEIFTTLTQRSDRSAYMLVYINIKSKDLILQDATEVPEQVRRLFEEGKKMKAGEETERALKNAKVQVCILGRDMIVGWDKPGLCPPDSPLYPSLNFATNENTHYKLTIPKHYKGKELRAELAAHITGEYRLWVFTPGFRNWEFKELKLNDCIESELTDKALFIDTENDSKIFTKERGNWEFAQNLEVSTDHSEETEVIEDLAESQTPSHAKAIVVYKWYDWNNGNPRLTLFKIATLKSTVYMSQVRTDLFTSWPNNEEDQPKMVLYLEKCKITDNKSKDNFANIYRYKQSDNYELTISKRGNFGIRHVVIDNGDAFIGEVPPDNPGENYIDAKSYIAGINDEIIIKCVHMDRLHDPASISRILLHSKKCESFFNLKSKLSLSQSQLISQIIEFFPNIEQDQVKLFSMKSGQTPVLLNTEEDVKGKKGLTNVCTLLENGNSIYFDIIHKS